MSQEPSEPPSPFEEDEKVIHALFAELRSEVALVSARFRGQVRERVEAAEARMTTTEQRGLVGSVIAQTLNLFTSAIGVAKDLTPPTIDTPPSVDTPPTDPDA